MTKKVFLIFFTLNLLNTVIAQSVFQLAIGGIYDDKAWSVIQTTDGGYALAGYSNSFGGGDIVMYIVKLNASGLLQWTKTVGQSATNYAYSIIQTTDGGYAVTGFTRSTAPYWDMYIVKLDASGSLQWNTTIGGNNDDEGWSIIQTTDGGYAVAGETLSFGAGNWDLYIVKIGASGTLQWNKTIGGTNIDYAYSIKQTPDGGYIVAGSTSSFGAGNFDMYIVKLDSYGTLQWNKTIGGSNNDAVHSIIKTTDGGYAAAGETNSIGAGNSDMYLVKFDSSGSLQWSKTFGGTNNDYAWSVIQTTEGGYALGGSTNSFGAGNVDCYIIKLDASGSLQWSKTIGRFFEDVAYSMIQTTDGGYALAGHTSFGSYDDMYLVRLDSSGNTCAYYTSPATTVTTPTPTVTTPSPTITTPSPVVTAPTPTVSTGGTITTLCLVSVNPLSNEIPNSYRLFQNYPNPFNPSTTIKFDIAKPSFVELIVYDIEGKEISRLVNEELNPGIYSIDWRAANFPSGIYFYTLTAVNYRESKRMVLVK